MKLPFAQIDAFADRPFTGNPAAVIPLEAWLDDAVLQAIAEANEGHQVSYGEDQYTARLARRAHRRIPGMQGPFAVAFDELQSLQLKDLFDRVEMPLVERDAQERSTAYRGETAVAEIQPQQIGVRFLMRWSPADGDRRPRAPARARRTRQPF